MGSMVTSGLDMQKFAWSHSITDAANHPINRQTRRVKLVSGQSPNPEPGASDTFIRRGGKSYRETGTIALSSASQRSMRALFTPMSPRPSWERE